MCKKNKNTQINLLKKKNGWSPSPKKIEGAEGTLSFKRKLTFGVDNLKKKANSLKNISRHIGSLKSPDAEKSTLLKRNNFDEKNHTQRSSSSHLMINSDDGTENTSFTFKRKVTFGDNNSKKKAYQQENIRHAEKSTLLKSNSFDDKNHTQTSLLSPVMISSDIGVCPIDAEKSLLLKRNFYDESNNTQTSLFSPAMINSDNDEAEETSFFSRKLKFKTDNSKERRNHMENIRYISPRNSPDFSNNEVPFDLEESTGRKSFSLCEDHDAINDKEFKKQIIRHIMYFKVELKHITNTLTNNHYELLERVQSIEKFLEDKPTKFYEQTNVDINCMSDCSIPIDNVVDLNTLKDKTLGDQEFKKALINELSHVGGKNVKTAVKRIMSKLFTNCFLADYSFTGKKGKKKFCDLFIFPIILKSIKKQVKFKSASDHEIEEPLKIYLAQAPFADKRSKTLKI